MKKFIDLLSNKYNVSQVVVERLLENMESRDFSNNQIIMDSNCQYPEFFLITKGFWRAYKQTANESITLWFERYNEVAYSEKSPNYVLESIGQSQAYCMSKENLDTLCAKDLDICNLIRLLFEDMYFNITKVSVDVPHVLAEQRYISIMENDPELIQMVPQKYIASFVGLTPQSLSRLKNKLVKQKK